MTVGRVCIDSGTVDEVVEDIVIRDRRHLSEDGIVLPIIAINKHTGRSETLPEVVTRGFSRRRRRLRADPGLAAGGGENARSVVARRDGRLGRDEGKDPRRSEALHRQADAAAPADHAGDPGGVDVTPGRRRLRISRLRRTRDCVPAGEAEVIASCEAASDAGDSRSPSRARARALPGGAVPSAERCFPWKSSSASRSTPGCAVAGPGFC